MPSKIEDEISSGNIKANAIGKEKARIVNKMDVETILSFSS